MMRSVEKNGPVIVAAIVAIIVGYLSDQVEPFSKAIAAMATTLGVVIAGFTGTQRHMILGMKGSRVIWIAVRTRGYVHILTYFQQCILASLLSSVISVFRFFLPESLEQSGLTWMVWLGLWSASFSASLLCLLRNELVMNLVITRWFEEQNNN